MVIQTCRNSHSLQKEYEWTWNVGCMITLVRDCEDYFKQKCSLVLKLYHIKIRIMKLGNNNGFSGIW